MSAYQIAYFTDTVLTLFDSVTISSAFFSFRRSRARTFFCLPICDDRDVSILENARVRLR